MLNSYDRNYKRNGKACCKASLSEYFPKKQVGEVSLGYPVDFEKGELNRGNWKRNKACMKKAEAGEPVKVGFLGGSITQGSLSSTPESC